jgi:hypothetical protein
VRINFNDSLQIVGTNPAFPRKLFFFSYTDCFKDLMNINSLNIVKKNCKRIKLSIVLLKFLFYLVFCFCICIGFLKFVTLLKILFSVPLST